MAARRLLAKIKRGAPWHRLGPEAPTRIHKNRAANLIDLHAARAALKQAALSATSGLPAELAPLEDRRPLNITTSSPAQVLHELKKIRLLRESIHETVSGETATLTPAPYHFGPHTHEPGLRVLIREVANRDIRAFDPGRHQWPVSNVDGPIDVVYTWVDGSDDEWRRRRDATLARITAMHGSRRWHTNATDSSRFIDSDELRYSLRSVFTFANWVNHIYIVTDRQVPQWLDLSHPKISIVDHSEILPRLTFNSHAIESALHRIPDIAERYLYLNDDVFFGRLAYPSDFFHPTGLAKFFPSDLPVYPGPPSIEDPPIMAAAKNGRDLIARRFGLTVTSKIRHTVHPQLRDVVEQMERESPREFELTRSSPFRAPTDISVASSLHHWYASALGRAVADEPNYLYLDISKPKSWQDLDGLAALRRYDTFCLNQEESGPYSVLARRELAKFLPKYFPLPAPWERDNT
ncbi:stealth family protein [Pseudactinotalea sp. HY158]|uniref:stealth family protein n=1 Tax=Pseudactinotalea sp. HY158 TaxID=2654547 RepID=UPI0018926D5A|nr:stealth family protein [Pseudactinotalea sp. HY158]